MPEMALRQFIHAEARKAAAALVAGVGHQHGVVVRRDANAVAPHDDEVVFDVLADLQHAVVFEQRLEARERVLHRQLGDLARAGEVEAVAGPMGERNVAGAVRLKRQRDAAKPRGHRIEVRGLGIEGDEALFGRGRDPVFKRLKIGDLDVARALEGEGFQLLRHAPRFRRWPTLGDGVSGRPRGRRGFERWRRRMDFTRGGRFDPEGLRDALRQRVEFHGAQEFEERIRVRIFDGGAIERLLDRHVFVEFDKAAGKPGLISEFRQPLAAHLLLDERRMSEQRFEISVLADQLGGRLDADARDARHVVDGVARERLHLHHLGGRHAELLQHLRFADHLVLHGVEHGDARLDELHQILVGRDDHNLAAGFHRVARIGRDDVVGLEALLLDASHVEGAHGVADQRELRHKLRRRIGPVRLVFGGNRVAEARLAVVEDDREMAGPLLALRFTQKLPQHVAEAVDRADRQAVGGPCQRRQRVKGAEDIARAVDEIDAASGRDGGLCAFAFFGGALGDLGEGHGANIGGKSGREPTSIAGFSALSLERLVRLAWLVAEAKRFRYGLSHAPVAQLDRVQDSESWGHRFKSCRVRQYNRRVRLKYPTLTHRDVCSWRLHGNTFRNFVATNLPQLNSRS